jgi:hypothetical protein
VLGAGVGLAWWGGALEVGGGCLRRGYLRKGKVWVFGGGGSNIGTACLM